MRSKFLIPGDPSVSSGVHISSAISSEPPSKSSQGSSYSFILPFYLIILFVNGVLHGGTSDLIHSSSVHQDSCWWSSSILLLASQGAIKSSYYFEMEFCISSFFLII